MVVHVKMRVRARVVPIVLSHSSPLTETPPIIAKRWAAQESSLNRIFLSACPSGRNRSEEQNGTYAYP